MADASKKTPATALAGLEKFAGQVFENSQGKYTLDDYVYADDLSLFSTAFFQIGAIAAAPLAIVGGSQQDLFITPFGQAGQGFVAGTTTNATLSLAETNLQSTQAGGKMGANQTYVGIAGGFRVYCFPRNVGNTAFVQQGGVPVPSANDLNQIVSSCVWQWNVGGLQSPTLVYEPIEMWPIGAGVTGIGAVGAVQAMSNGGPVSTMRKFAFPLMFPPNIGAQLKISFARGVTDIESLNNLSVIAVAMHLRGYTLSKSV